MPSVHGYVTEEQKDQIEELLDRGAYEDQSDFVHFCVGYVLKHKHS